MIEEVVLITISAVLFVQMGLSEAIQETIHFHSKIASCPRCCAFWSTLVYCVLTDNGIIVSVSASFISSYAALWLALIYDALARLYNMCYEAITETTDTQDAEASTDDSEAATDVVS